jgi:hypothetical protein
MPRGKCIRHRTIVTDRAGGTFDGQFRHYDAGPDAGPASVKAPCLHGRSRSARARTPGKQMWGNARINCNRSNILPVPTRFSEIVYVHIRPPNLSAIFPAIFALIPNPAMIARVEPAQVAPPGTHNRKLGRTKFIGSIKFASTRAVDPGGPGNTFLG